MLLRINAHNVSALEYLQRKGGHLVCCNRNKLPVHSGWQQQPYDRSIRKALQRGHVFGLIPASLTLLCVDIDAGTLALPEPLCTLPSRKRGEHYWYTHTDGITKYPWRTATGKGDIIHAGGYVILWHNAAEQLAAALKSKRIRRLADLPPHDQGVGGGGGTRPYAPVLVDEAAQWVRAADEGQRNARLFSAAYTLLCRYPKTSHSLILRELRGAGEFAGLPHREVAATLRSAERRAS